MDQDARQHSVNLELVARPLAQWTVTRHAERDETLGERYGGGWREAWVGDVGMRLRYLTQSIAVRRPSLFSLAVAWTGDAFRARSIDRGDVQVSLECMREVMDSELPEPLRGVALAHADDALIDLARAGEASEQPLVTPSGPHQELSLRYLEAVLSGERRVAESIVLGAAEEGVTVPDLYAEVLQPALVSIGRLWHAGEISIADEHLATTTTDAIMSLLRISFPSPPKRGRSMVAAATAGELHVLGVRMVADFFEMDGWDATYLGANMPADGLVDLLGDRTAHVLAASVTSFLHVRALGDLVDAVRGAENLGDLVVLVGGTPCNAIPDLWEELGADGCAPSAAGAVALANQILDDRG
jgi:methanogenic corrinoid protein MtbC1